LFQTYVVSVLSECCRSRSECCMSIHVASICFQVFSCVSYICLQVFHLYIIYICNGFSNVFQTFSQMFQTLVSSVSCPFFMLQLLYLDVSKIDWMLHMRCAWEVANGTGDVQGTTRAHCWCTRLPTRCASRLLSSCADTVRTLAPGSEQVRSIKGCNYVICASI
jgi:hypothetical protein